MSFDVSQYRRKSWAALRERGVVENASLPLLDSHAQIMDVRTHIDRTLCLHAVIGCAFGFPRKKAWHWIESQKIVEGLTESDRKFLSGDETLRLQKQADVHCLFVLVWALSLLPAITLEEQIPDDLVHKLPELWVYQDAAGFRDTAKQRPAVDILESLDMAFCLHWWLVDAQLSNQNSAHIAALPVVARRRLALEWLSSPLNWDEINLDT